MTERDSDAANERSKVAFETPWFQIIEQHLKDARGQGHLYYHLKSSDGVVILPFTREGHVILVRQHRPAIASSSLEFPAGGVEQNESPIDAAKRELGEETGLISERWHDLGTGYSSMDRIANQLHGFLALDCMPAPQLKLNEDIEVVSMPLKELRGMAATGEYKQLGGLGFLLKAEWMIGNILK